MWYDELPDQYSWSSLWYGYVICGKCKRIRRLEIPCAVCGEPPPNPEESCTTRPNVLTSFRALRFWEKRA